MDLASRESSQTKFADVSAENRNVSGARPTIVEYHKDKAYVNVIASRRLGLRGGRSSIRERERERVAVM